MKQIPKQSICIIYYNGNFDINYDNNMKVTNIGQSFNKLCIWLPANNSMTHIMKVEWLRQKIKLIKL